MVLVLVSFADFTVIFFPYNLQAYTNELEKEVANLMKENARLKRQQEQVTLFQDIPFFLNVF